ncbi:hypothetical protein PROFUN_13287 [Planoprotostelium fungivorum]|uniref:Uncharacterized protein n=1 Tax=Planoprotostelium fungivorum TaxID=1890364 RepID=A0A2P6N4P2_9EUKA|nr:hypothetical protein PROFUN_13287 [Planoprotostelium fungivorum]
MAAQKNKEKRASGSLSSSYNHKIPGRTQTDSSFEQQDIDVRVISVPASMNEDKVWAGKKGGAHMRSETNRKNLSRTPTGSHRLTDNRQTSENRPASENRQTEVRTEGKATSTPPTPHSASMVSVKLPISAVDRIHTPTRGNSPNGSKGKTYLHPNHPNHPNYRNRGSHTEKVTNQQPSSAEGSGEKRNRARNVSKEQMIPHPEMNAWDVARGRLNKKQTERLTGLLDEEYNIVSKDGTIRFTISPYKLIARLIAKLSENSIHSLDTGIRLVGSGAAHTLMDDENFFSNPNHEHVINDIDFCFYVPKTVKFHEVLQIEEGVLCDIIEEEMNMKLTVRDVYEKFFLDSVKVEDESNSESWSLITIGEMGLRTIDIKFVIKSRRSWVFSADSFEIVLDALFDQLMEVAKPSNGKKSPRKQEEKKLSEIISSLTTSAEAQLRENSIMVESLYADYAEALLHLKTKRLYTKRPEDIRRGIFRYCHELAKGKTPANEDERIKLDKVRHSLGLTEERQAFVKSFLNEKTSNFEEVLRKFLMKHTSSSLHCLDQLYDIFIRSGCEQIPEMISYLQIVSMYRERYEKLTHTFPSGEKESPIEGFSEVARNVSAIMTLGFWSTLRAHLMQFYVMAVVHLANCSTSPYPGLANNPSTLGQSPSVNPPTKATHISKLPNRLLPLIQRHSVLFATNCLKMHKPTELLLDIEL